MLDEKSLVIAERGSEIVEHLDSHLSDTKYQIAKSHQEAINLTRTHKPQVFIHDLGISANSDGRRNEGLQLIHDILSVSPSTKVIVITEKSDYQNALRAISLGAHDFYQRPITPNTLNLFLERAQQIHEMENQNARLINEQDSPLKGVITGDPRMLKICRTIEKIAQANLTSLLLGESGTGKEVLAKSLHAMSSRSSKRFMAINCASIPENLMESELFGYEKGAFTGATKQTRGKIEIADKGTLFLDEIGDMPLALQAKLLRFLQERTIERVGGHIEIPVDVRVICATNKNLTEMVEKETFREDLYYRISEVVIEIPPLRDRIGDKSLLAKHFLHYFRDSLEQNVIGFTQEAMKTIESYRWPGNIREMENRIKRAVIMADHKRISAQDLDLPVNVNEITLNLREARKNAEVSVINKALSIAQGNMSEAAKLLSVTRPTLYDLVKKYGIET